MDEHIKRRIVNKYKGGIFKIRSKYCSGTGFAIAIDQPYCYIVTASHVVSGKDQVSVFRDNQDLGVAQVLKAGSPYGTNEGDDLAVIRLDLRCYKGKLTLLKLAPTVELHKPVFVAGYGRSLQFEEISREISKNDIKIQLMKDEVQPNDEGVISEEVRVNDSIPVYNSNCRMHHGDSGAPAFNEKGEVVGVAVAGINPKTSDESLRFIISNQFVMQFLKESRLYELDRQDKRWLDQGICLFVLGRYEEAFDIIYEYLFQNEQLQYNESVLDVMLPCLLRLPMKKAFRKWKEVSKIDDFMGFLCISVFKEFWAYKSYFTRVPRKAEREAKKILKSIDEHTFQHGNNLINITEAYFKLNLKVLDEDAIKEIKEILSDIIIDNNVVLSRCRLRESYYSVPLESLPIKTIIDEIDKGKGAWSFIELDYLDKLFEICRNRDTVYDQLYEEMAALGDYEALYQVGNDYFWGNNGKERNRELAFDYYSLSAELGYVDSQFMLGDLYFYKVFGKDLQAEDRNLLCFHWFQKAALQNHSEAQFFAGVVAFDYLGKHEEGMNLIAESVKTGFILSDIFVRVRKSDGSFISEKEALDEQKHLLDFEKLEYISSFDSTDEYVRKKTLYYNVWISVAHFYVAIVFEFGIDGVINPDWEKAKAYYKISLEMGNQYYAAYRLGLLLLIEDHENGDALKYSQLAAEHGQRYAWRTIAQYYECRGDFESAISFHKKAADLDVPESMASLSWFYFTGYLVEYDLTKGRSLLIKAAQAGVPYAMRKMGVYHLTNMYEFEFDEQKGIEMILKAAEQGDKVAMYDMALFLLKGDYLGRNVEKAIGLLIQSAEADIGEACFLLAMLYLGKVSFFNELDEGKGNYYMNRALQCGNPSAEQYYGYCLLAKVAEVSNIMDRVRAKEGLDKTQHVVTDIDSFDIMELSPV